MFKFHHIHIHLESPRTLLNVDNDYFEQMIRFLEYCNGNLEKAKETWPWKNTIVKNLLIQIIKIL